MAGVLDDVNQRTQLVGTNRLEMLLFRLHGKQRYGINVFKVQEVIQCPTLTHLPNSHPVVCGVATMRGRTIPVMDLSLALGMVAVDDPSKCFIIVTEYNRSVQGFLVSAVERIVNLNWEQIIPPPKATGEGNYLTAVTRVENELIEIIDVEKVLAEVVNPPVEVSKSIIDEANVRNAVQHLILVADDSSVARHQIKRTLDQISVEKYIVENGKQAFDLLKEWSNDGVTLQRLAMVISDIEMPEMDGYTLTTQIRKDPKLAHIHVLLHTSLSGIFNQAMVEKAGADEFIAKFRPDELAVAIVNRINALKAVTNS